MSKIIKTPFTALIFLVLMLSLQHPSTHSKADPGYQIYLPFIQYNLPTWIGPGGGSITCLAVDPQNPATIYAGTWGAGIFKSTDGALTWHTANQGLENAFINSIAINPLHPEILLAGDYKDAIYRSDNGGGSWTLSNAGVQAQATTYAIAFNPENPDQVFASTRGISNNGVAPWNGVLYKSYDSGHSWTPKLTNVGGSSQQDWAYSLAISPNSPNTIYAALHEHGVYMSTDNGENWKSTNNGISDGSGRSVVVDPLNFKLAYYGVWHDSGVFKTTDGGANWSRLAGGSQDTKIYNMAIDPGNPQTVYLGSFTNGILKTVDGGKSWTGAGLPSDQIYALAVQPKNSQQLLSGTVANGLFASQDGGTQWGRSSNGLHASSVTAVAWYHDQMYASVYGSGVFTSPISQTLWSDLSLNLGDRLVQYLVPDPGHPNLLYSLTSSSGLYQMDLDSSQQWASYGINLPKVAAPQVLSLPLSPIPYPDDVFPPDPEPFSVQATQSDSLLVMVFAPSAPQIVALGLGSSGVYISTDSAANWHPAGLGGQSIWSLAFDPQNDQKLYAAGNMGGSVRYTSNQGASWESLPSLPVNTVNKIAISPVDSTILLAATSAGLYQYSPASGWTLSGFSGTPIQALSIQPGMPTHILVSTSQDTYFSDDNGQTWNGPMDALHGVSVQAIFFDPARPTNAYFCTQTRGIMRLGIW